MKKRGTGSRGLKPKAYPQRTAFDSSARNVSLESLLRAVLVRLEEIDLPRVHTAMVGSVTVLLLGQPVRVALDLGEDVLGY